MPNTDRRDDLSWVVVELTRAGELKLEEGLLERTLRKELGVGAEHKFFIPAIMYQRGGKRVLLQLMEGYVFIATGLPETVYIALERESLYVKKVLRTIGLDGFPVLSVLPNEKVEGMREQLREMVADEITLGMPVRVTQGVYAKLDGAVLELEGAEAHVYIELRSFKVVRSIPRVFLEPLEKDFGP